MGNELKPLCDSQGNKCATTDVGDTCIQEVVIDTCIQQVAIDCNLYSKFGFRDATPMRNFTNCTFIKINQADVDYFNLMIDSDVLNALVIVQRVVLGPDAFGHALADMLDLATRDAFVAWALTSLAQTRRASRQCCFLQMALVHRDNVALRKQVSVW